MKSTIGCGPSSEYGRQAWTQVTNNFGRVRFEFIALDLSGLTRVLWRRGGLTRARVQRAKVRIRNRKRSNAVQTQLPQRPSPLLVRRHRRRPELRVPVVVAIMKGGCSGLIRAMRIGFLCWSVEVVVPLATRIRRRSRSSKARSIVKSSPQYSLGLGISLLATCTSHRAHSGRGYRTLMAAPQSQHHTCSRRRSW